MPFSLLTYTYSGGPQTFQLAFALGYLERSDVRVNVIGELDAMGNPINRAFTFNSENEILVTDTIAMGATVRISRTVSKTALPVDFSAPGSATREALDINSRYLIMAVQEALDGRLDGSVENLDELSSQVFSSRASALASATSAATSATTASTAQTAASASASAAAASQSSASSSAILAQSSATSSASSESSARNSATTAANSVRRVAASASTARIAETTATTASQQAAISASSALTSQQRASASAIQASQAAESAAAGGLSPSNNLSDVQSASTARTNLGLGALATRNSVNLANSTVTGNLAGSRVALATQTVPGVVERATGAEGTTGTSTSVVPSVAVVKSMIDTHSSGGGNVLLSNTNITSNLTSLIISGSSLFDTSRFLSYEIHIEELKGSLGLAIRLGSTSGAAYNGTGSYAYSSMYNLSNGTVVLNGPSSNNDLSTLIKLVNNDNVLYRMKLTSNSWGLSGIITLSGIGSGSYARLTSKTSHQTDAGSNVLLGGNATAIHTSTNAVGSLGLLPLGSTSTNRLFKTGRVRMYGVPL